MNCARRLEWTYQGVTYRSLEDAARKLGISATQARRLSKISGELRAVSNMKAVSRDNIIYPSVKSAIEQTGLSRTTLYARLKSQEYPTWFYVEETRSNDYPEKE